MIPLLFVYTCITDAAILLQELWSVLYSTKEEELIDTAVLVQGNLFVKRT